MGHKEYSDKKFKYLRQMSTKRAQTFTEDNGSLQVLFHRKNMEKPLFLCSKTDINNDFHWLRTLQNATR